MKKLLSILLAATMCFAFAGCGDTPGGGGDGHAHEFTGEWVKDAQFHRRKCTRSEEHTSELQSH